MNEKPYNEFDSLPEKKFVLTRRDKRQLERVKQKTVKQLKSKKR